ncbi:MAG: glycosyltransferase 87 family protein [Gordonia sp. (in: high G+C Gram-positive bacteria)]
MMRSASQWRLVNSLRRVTSPAETADPVGLANPAGLTTPAALPQDRRTDTARVIPGRSDPIVAQASRIVGGPQGAHAVVGRSRRWTPIRVLFALALCALALGWYGKAGCLQQAPATNSADHSTLRLDWDNQRQFTDLCYSDVIALYGAERLDRGEFPYGTYWLEGTGTGNTVKRYMEYPVLTGLSMYGAAWVARKWQAAHERWGVPAALSVVLFFDLVALGLALCWLVTVWATALTDRTRIWAAWLAALSPLVVVHAFTNFDAIAVALVALAILAWSREKPWLAGMFIGLGIASKWYPVLLLVVLFVLCLRARRMGDFAVTAAAAVLSWVVVNAPIAILYPRGWVEFFRYNIDRNADSDTPFRIVADAMGVQWSVPILNVVSLTLLAAVLGGVGYLALRAPTRPRLAQLAFLAVAGFLVVGKVWSPQYSLWLVPLAVLAIANSRLLLAWMAVDALVWIPRMTLFLDPDRRWLPEGWFIFAVILRGIVVIALCVVVVWQIYHPDTDHIRRDRLGRIRDDPTGGVLDGALGAYAGPEAPQRERNASLTVTQSSSVIAY